MNATRFAYRAARADGVAEIGEIAAENRDAALATLAARGLWAMDVRPGRARWTVRTTLTMADMALGLRVMATLLESGLPVGKSLAAMPDLAPVAWVSALPDLQQAVREGASLATALDRSEMAVPPVVVGIIRAGEAGSGLAAAVRRAASLMEEAAATRGAIRAALVYPAVLAVAGTASVAILVGVVLPRFAKILDDLGQTLPASTRTVLFASTVLRAWWLPVTAATLTLWGAWRTWVRTPVGAQRWAGLVLAAPFIGPIRRSAATARVCAALAAL